MVQKAKGNQPDINKGFVDYRTAEGAILVDVRTPKEYREGHIPGSKNVPLQQLDKISSVTDNKNVPMFVYCYSGGRSRQATYMLQDWNRCVDAINAVSTYSDRPEPVLRCIFDQLLAFDDRHKAVIRDEAAGAAFAASFGRYHELLRSQLASPLRKFCDSDFAARFIAEALLTWTVEGTDFEEIQGMIGKLF